MRSTTFEIELSPSDKTYPIFTTAEKTGRRHAAVNRGDDVLLPGLSGGAS